jgi:Cys-tRNA(Pro) deacylase
MSEEISAGTEVTRVLQLAGVEYSEHFYSYEEGGGTAACAKELNIDEHSIVKTIVLEICEKPVIVLMHGDMRVSIKDLARIIEVQNITPCLSERAEQLTGHQFGSISPFSARPEMAVYMEETLLNLRKVYTNGGKQGYLIGLDPYEIVKILHPTLVKVGSARAA